MLLQSIPPDFAIPPAIDFGRPQDRQPPEGRVRDNTTHHGSVAELLDSVAEMAEVRPVVFDRQQALTRLGGLEDLLIEVMQVMQTECPTVHAQIHTALARREAIELKRAAHTLRGSVCIVGASDLATRLRRVEDLAAANNFDAVADELPEINRQFNALQRCLNDELRIEQL